MRSRDLYQTDLERRLYGLGSDRAGTEAGDEGSEGAVRGSSKRGRTVRWAASLLAIVGGLGAAYWIYRRSRDRDGTETPSPEFPEGDGSELAA